MVDELVQVGSGNPFGKLRQKLGEKKVRLQMRASTKRAKRKADKSRITRIREQETRSLERRFIRRQEKAKLAKKFKVKEKPKATVGEAFLFGKQPEKKKKAGITLF